MAAATFWSYDHPSESRGYPPELASAIATIAITTCIAANFLLAHVATLSRNKLAEVSIIPARSSVYLRICVRNEQYFRSFLPFKYIPEAVLMPGRKSLTCEIVIDRIDTKRIVEDYSTKGERRASCCC